MLRLLLVFKQTFAPKFLVNDGGFQKMKLSMSISLCLLLTVIAFAPSSIFAQAAEIQPYGGYYWPGNNNNVGDFKDNSLVGVRGGGYLTKDFEIGGNYAWISHFQPKNSNIPSAFAGGLGFPQGHVGASILEAEFTYNFGSRNLHFGSSARPYVVGGAGALRTKVNDPDVFVMNVNTFRDSCGCIKHTANDVMEDGDAFFTFSYGGGLKWHRVWGPMGFFGDFRGRTIPNFFGSHNTSPEITGGLTFSWGEK
jgi:hypothetical protein